MESVFTKSLIFLFVGILFASTDASFLQTGDLANAEIIRVSENVQFSKFNESFIQLPISKGHQLESFEEPHASNRRLLKSCPPSDKNLMAKYTSLHNKERNALYKRPLKWDNCLAARAKNWATKMALKACALPPKKNAFGYTVTNSPGNLGENLFYSWYYQGYDVWNTSTIMNYWTSQKNNYSYQKNKCSRNKYCGNYLQIIWKPATTFGCGVAACNLKYAKNWKLKVGVCNYDKQFFFDARPY